MKKTQCIPAVVCALYLLSCVGMTRAAISPVSGTVNVNAYATISDLPEDSTSDSLTITPLTCQAGLVQVVTKAVSEDSEGPEWEWSYAESGVSIEIFDGIDVVFLQLQGGSSAEVTSGSGYSGSSLDMTFTFSLDQQSYCGIWAGYNGNHFSLEDSTGQTLFDLSDSYPISTFDNLLLDAGEYTVIGQLSASANIEDGSNMLNDFSSAYFHMNMKVTPVPEPMTLSLLGFGGLLVLRKRK